MVDPTSRGMAWSDIQRLLWQLCGEQVGPSEPGGVEIGGHISTAFQVKGSAWTYTDSGDKDKTD